MLFSLVLFPSTDAAIILIHIFMPMLNYLFLEFSRLTIKAVRALNCFVVMLRSYEGLSSA